MERTSRELRKDLHRLIDIALRFGLEEEAAKPRHRLDDLEFGALVMIVGEGNFGKSSLINAIANRSIASTNVLPATTKVDIFTAAADGQSHARVRRIGRQGWETLDIESARSICRAEEERVRSGQAPELSDAVWAFADAEIPDSICLVDTPGIAQDLLGSLTARSIVSGFDVAYSVEDVWAYWIHRADIVLWVFEANRPESAETRRALERFLSIYDKPICPIATKIDRVAPERVAEVVRHFENTYRDLLETRRCDPLRCVCCAPGHARYGDGITELRLRLRELAAEAVAIKETANQEFIKQQARLLDRELRAISEMIVGNLRTIALMGDECAVIFEQECAQMMDAIYYDVNAFTAVKRSQLVGMWPSLASAWEQTGRRSGSEAAMERAEADLLSVIDVSEIRTLVTQRGTQFAEHIARRCKVQSEACPVKSVRISNSGQVTEHSSSLSVEVHTVNVDVQVALPIEDVRMEIEEELRPGCFCAPIVLFKAIKSIILTWLSNLPKHVKNHAHGQLRSQLGSAVLEGVSNALWESLGRDERNTLSLLERLDRTLDELRYMHEADVPTNSYRAWAGYWASLNPTVEELARVIEAECAPTLEDLRKSLLRVHVHLSDICDTAFLEQYLRRMASIHAVVPGASPRSVCIELDLRIAEAIELCALREGEPTLLEEKKRIREVAKQVKQRKRKGVPLPDRKVYRVIQKTVDAQIRQCAIHTADALLARVRDGREGVDNVVDTDSKRALTKKLGDRLCQPALEQLEVGLDGRISSEVECEVVMGKLLVPPGWTKRIATLAVAACALARAAAYTALYFATRGASVPWAAAIPTLLGVLSGGLMVAIVAALYVGHARIRAQITARMLGWLRTVVEGAVTTARTAAAELATPSWLRSVVQDAAAAAAPRPLQKLAIELRFRRRP